MMALCLIRMGVWRVDNEQQAVPVAGEGEARKLLIDFFTSPSYDPKAKRHGDTVEAAIRFTLARARLTEPARKADRLGEGDREAREAIARVIGKHGAAHPWHWHADFDDGEDKTAERLRNEDRAAADDVLAALPDPTHTREALEACLKFIESFRDSGVELLAEGVHAGLRKGSDAPDAGELYTAIANSHSSAWSDAISFAHDPFFSMWGGDEAIKKARAALSAGSAQS
jgi:hypothetical protein